MGNLGEDISLQVNVCCQCGDIGISEALVYCIMCKNAARHSYCFDELPEDFTAEIDWFCEDCRSKPTPTSLEILDHGSGRPVIGQNNPCQETGSANDDFVNSLDQHPVSDVRIGSGLIVPVKDELNTEERYTISPTSPILGGSRFQGTSSSFVEKKLSGTAVEQSNRHTIERTLINDTAMRSSACFTQKKNEIEEHEKGDPKRISTVPCKDRLDSFHPIIDGHGTNISFAVERLVCASIEQSDNKTSMKTSGCGTNASGAVGSSTCVELKGGDIEEQKVMPMVRMIMPGMDQLDDIRSPIEGQGSSFRLAAKRLPGTSIEESGKQTIGSTSRCNNDSLGKVRSSACVKLEEGEIKAQVDTRRRRRRSRSSRRTLIPPVKGERENFHPVIFCEGNNIPIVAKTVSVIPVKAFDKQIISRIKTSDTSGEIRSSVCFELKKGEMDRYRNDKLESRSLILPTKDELNNLHAVIDRRDTNMKLVSTILQDTSVVPSENHTRWVDTEVQIKFPWQPASHSLPLVFHVWRGCFNINKIEIGPLRAHLSIGACLKVCNLARKLSLVLHMQKLPRLVGWPNSFKVSSPTVENIALYFFPESYRVETVLNELVDDLINKDLMLRFEFDEVELLVFSSFVLPQEHQRIFGKYYPWGVFKPRSSKICSLPAGSHTGYQAGDLLRPVRRSEVEDHDDGLFKYSAQEINDYTLRRSLIQPKEGKLRVTADSTVSSEEERLQTLHKEPSELVQLLWHSDEQHGDRKRKLDFEMSENYTLELKKVAEEIRQN